MKKPYDNLNQFYLDTLDYVYHHYDFKNTPRGFAEQEILGFSQKLGNPIARFCYHPKRRQNIIFNYAEALWYLSGKNDLSFIQWYAPSMSRFSADNKTLPGTGYGKKLFHFGSENINQIERALDILKQDDSDSKRVFLQIFSADENIYKCNIDVSCTLGLQLLLREDELHMVAYMRANDAYVGMLSDIFSFTFLQEFLASLLECKVGTYTHHVGSIHIYKNNIKNVKSILKDSNKNIFTDPILPKMPYSNFDVITEVLKFERKIRLGIMTLEEINDLSLNEYWKDILRLFKANTYIRENRDISEELLANLSDFHRSFLLNRHTITTIVSKQEGVTTI
ncbi:thymidylate synthase [Vibrio crassostreae]|nr:thymidylate synthase [Vibrio crassostreae]CAK2078900.1 thymidylate synthase [Vibrio crassostreae]CAK2079432.1 thymidylate synthase [Vibrio crassostreae]CAK2083407.1 thymidylate synthase [Vibrio crassostreae]CAK2086319.1 thymidylate synthase [Vibrio crassostreae]